MGLRCTGLQTGEMAERWSVSKCFAIHLHYLSGGVANLLGPRFCFLAVEGHSCTHHPFLHLPVGARTRTNVHFHLRRANEEWYTSRYVSPPVIRAWYVEQHRF